MIALLCPSKGRAEKLRRMIESVAATTSLSITIYVGLTSEEHMMDNEVNPWFKWANEFYKNNNKRIKIGTQFYPDLMPTAQKWNYLADIAMKESYEIFFLAGDDMIFNNPGWDVALTNHYEGLANKIHVYHLQDSRDRDAIPHPIMTREYIEAMGYFVPPIFLHWFIDTWTTEIAKANNCFTHLRDYLLIHDKDNDKGKPDLTHTGIRSYGWRDRDGYVDKHCKHFLELEKKRLGSNMKFGFGKGHHPFEETE